MVFLAAAGPVGSFFFGLATSKLWEMIEGMQMIAMYPMLWVETPGNITLLQAVMRKISTFELIDGDILKEHIWDAGEYEEEDLSLYLGAAGIDSFLF
jgi:hypothetical protein